MESNQDLFSASIHRISLADAFTNYLNYSVLLALAINTEKARSEMIIAPILVELKRQLNDQISLFSGISLMLMLPKNSRLLRFHY